MPGELAHNIVENLDKQEVSFLTLLKEGALRTTKNVLLMSVLVYLLTFLQRILSEFGIIKYISKFLKPVMLIFGLSPRSAFLWLIANTLGLAYGAAVMIDEAKQGNTTKEENDLLNHHICISHSNLEDLILFTAIGGSFPWMLLSRWCMSLVLVWERKAEYAIRKAFVTNR